jgi:hypothetical protein
VVYSSFHLPLSSGDLSGFTGVATHQVRIQACNAGAAHMRCAAGGRACGVGLSLSSAEASRSTSALSSGRHEGAAMHIRLQRLS